jgi:hypothetical protein
VRKLILLAISIFTVVHAREGFRCVPDVAQYKGADYSNVVRVERGISLERAFEIADNLPEADYFIYVKGWQMVLEVPSDGDFDPKSDPFNLLSHTPYITDAGVYRVGYCRIFRHGDVLFFREEGKWLGTAPDLANAYFKVKKEQSES